MAVAVATEPLARPAALPPPRPKASRIAYLDALRTISIMGVVATHVVSVARPIPFNNPERWWTAT
jgi:peptidoglycan/LPS O-acetylase OafA/YrhL